MSEKRKTPKGFYDGLRCNYNHGGIATDEERLRKFLSAGIHPDEYRFRFDDGQDMVQTCVILPLAFLCASRTGPPSGIGQECGNLLSCIMSLPWCLACCPAFLCPETAEQCLCCGQQMMKGQTQTTETRGEGTRAKVGMFGTLLHKAVWDGNEEAIALLIKAGSSLRRQTSRGYTAAEIAALLYEDNDKVKIKNGEPGATRIPLYSLKRETYAMLIDPDYPPHAAVAVSIVFAKEDREAAEKVESDRRRDEARMENEKRWMIQKEEAAKAEQVKVLQTAEGQLWVDRRRTLVMFLRLNRPEDAAHVNELAEGMFSMYSFGEIVKIVSAKHPDVPLPPAWVKDVETENMLGPEPDALKPWIKEQLAPPAPVAVVAERQEYSWEQPSSHAKAADEPKRLEEDFATAFAKSAAKGAGKEAGKQLISYLF